MTIMQLEVAYRTVGPLSQKTSNDLLSEGDLYRKHLKYIPTKDRRIEVGYERDGNGLDFYVFLDGRCEGNVSFKTDLEDELTLSKEQAQQVRSLFKGTVVVVPHVLMRGLKGLGYASFIYTKALTSGMTLITGEHTADAVGLWESLSRKFNLFYFDPQTGKFGDTGTKDNLKVLTKLAKPKGGHKINSPKKIDPSLPANKLANLYLETHSAAETQKLSALVASMGRLREVKELQARAAVIIAMGKWVGLTYSQVMQRGYSARLLAVAIMVRRLSTP